MDYEAFLAECETKDHRFVAPHCRRMLEAVIATWGDERIPRPLAWESSAYCWLRIRYPGEYQRGMEPGVPGSVSQAAIALVEQYVEHTDDKKSVWRWKRDIESDVTGGC